MTQEEFREKLARLVYRFVNNNEDADKKELRKIEQKPAWSKEDERKITGISMVLESWDSYHVSSAGLPSLIPEYISWLNALKERIQP